MTQAVALAQQASTGVSQGFKNRIINGAMVIDQRTAGASTTVTTTGYFSCDRWQAGATQSSKFSIQQNAGSVTPPAGFTNYLGVTSLSSYSLGAADAFYLVQQIEGYNIADLGWGTANAKTVTLSFWVRSSLTGTFTGCFYNGAANRSYVFSYTISSANTWTQISVTITGDTTGTWNTGNTQGIGVVFSLGYGSNYNTPAGSWNANFYASVSGATNVVSTNGATFYVTGVQLEVGSTATSFDYRPYGTELSLCQRYFYQTNRYVGLTQANDTLYGPAIAFPVTMRTTPTLNAGATFTARTGSNGTPLISSGVTGIVATNDAVAVYNSSSNWNTNTWVSFNGGFTAEL
jgi:hypothetical protein